MQEEEETRRLLNTGEVAEPLGVSKRTVEKWVSLKRIPSVKLGTAGRGSLPRFRPDSLNSWIAAQEVQTDDRGSGGAGRDYCGVSEEQGDGPGLLVLTSSGLILYSDTPLITDRRLRL